MDLLVVRHAISMSRSEFTREDDSLRPLTDEGRTKMRSNCRGLWTIAPAFEILATSPFTRARQTADIVEETYPGEVDVLETDSLVPSAEPDEFLDWIVDYSAEDAVAIVGHEPSLSTISSWLLSGREHSFIDLKKGSGLLLELPSPPSGGSGELRWYLVPQQLRSLAD